MHNSQYCVNSKPTLYKMERYILCIFVLFCINVLNVHGHAQNWHRTSALRDDLKNHQDSKISLTYSLNPLTRTMVREDGKSCIKPGLMCEDCQKVSYCIQMPGGAWLKEDMDDCPSGTTCLESTGTCTEASNPSCEGSVPGYEFVCRQAGVFPDPFNCQRYHMCVPGNGSEVVKTSIKMKCDSSFYYDPLTTLCRKKLVDGKCPVVTPNCTTPAQSGPIAQNPSLYYICLKSGSVYFPQIFACPYNEFFYDSIKSCRDPTPPSHNSCKTSGIFYDPNNCKQYYSCNSAGSTPIGYKCDSAGTLFYNSVIERCVLFSCSDLKDRW